jgi:hypothetical protein
MVVCWWCCHPYEGKTVHMPYKYDEKLKKFYTTGNFCSWGCCKAFALDRYGTNKGSIVSQNIALMRLTMNPKSVIRTSKAPSRYLLQMFGGDMTIDEFRNISKDDFPTFQLPNEVYMLPLVQKKAVPTTVPNVTKGVNDLQSKIDEINQSSTHNEPLRLKRPKPLKRDQNNLETSLGIVRMKK